MNSPYMGKFKVTQTQTQRHDGLDLVGIDSNEIHSTINGVVVHSGWEDKNDHSKGFGLYVVIVKDDTDDFYFFGHLKKTLVSVGDHVRITDLIGIEGSTGKSTGSHCHYCARRQRDKKQPLWIPSVSGIPNKRGVYDDGYRPSEKIEGVTELRPGFWNVRNRPSFDSDVVRIVRGPQSVTYVDVIDGFYKLRDGNFISVKACIDR